MFNPLSGYAPGSSVGGIALITSSIIRQSANGNEYARWRGFDCNAENIQGTYFGPNNNPPNLQPGAVYSIKGSIGQSRNMDLDVWASSMELVTDESVISEFKKSCYPSVPEQKLSEIMANLLAYVNSIQDDNLRALASKIFEEYKEDMTVLPAGKKVHDARRGGLAEHTYEVLTIINNQLLMNKILDYDVLIFSALFHDIGKIRSYTDQIEMSEQGLFIPHIVESVKIVTEHRVLGDFSIPDNKMWHIEHCISSHHGKDASPVNPCSREALAIHFADYMVSSIAHVDTFILNGEVGEDGWTPYSRQLGGSAYIPDLDSRV